MEQEIWHDDLYATRTHPVKKRQCNRKPCVKFVSDNGLQPDEIVRYEPKISVDELTKKYKASIDKAVYLESHLRKESVAYPAEIKETIRAYQVANILALTDKQKAFCEQRVDLLNNMKTMWR